MKTYQFVLEDPHKILYKYIITIILITLILAGIMFFAGLFDSNKLLRLIPLGFFAVFLLPISFLFNRKCNILLDEEKIEIHSIDHKLWFPDVHIKILWKDIEGVVRQRYGAKRNQQMFESITFKLKDSNSVIKIIANIDNTDFPDFVTRFRSKIMNVIVPDNPAIIKFLIRRKLS